MSGNGVKAGQHLFDLETCYSIGIVWMILWVLTRECLRDAGAQVVSNGHTSLHSHNCG